MTDNVKTPAPAKGLPTQLVHPWATALRTFLQAFGPQIFVVLIAAPQIVEQFEGTPLADTPVYPILVSTALGLSLLAAAAARVMAIPAVEALVRKTGAGTGVHREPIQQPAKQTVTDEPPKTERLTG